MIGPGIPHRLVLASASPRRRRLFGWLGPGFETASVETPEDLDTPLAADPPALAMHLAAEKSLALAEDTRLANAVVLTFDTIVVLDGALLGKPADEADARRMLRELSGRAHEVVTGCVLACPGEEPTGFAVTTRVRMHDLDDAAIARWMTDGEYSGCAGAYNIEGGVASVSDDECYQNVVGLPLCHVYAALRDLAISPAVRAVPPVATCDRSLGRSCRLGPRVVATPPADAPPR